MNTALILAIHLNRMIEEGISCYVMIGEAEMQIERLFYRHPDDHIILKSKIGQHHMSILAPMSFRLEYPA